MKLKNKEPENIETQEVENIVNKNIESFQDSNEFTQLLLALEDSGVSQESLISWKENYVNIYISQIHENGVYFIWKKLNRTEYKQVAESGAMAKENSYQDAILRKCMLFPKADQQFLAFSDAGVVPTLFTQIMYQSGFIPENLAISFITEI